MSRLLIIGASGFIGRFVTATFASEDYTVRAAVRDPSTASHHDGVEVVQCADFEQTAVDWRPLVEGVNTIIHLAGLAHTRGGSDALYDRINRRATAELVAAAAKAGVKRFVFVSSVRAQIGASTDHVLIESDPALPTDAYGRSKLAAEASVRAAGIPFTILRPVLVYGPGVKGNFSWLMRTASTPMPLPVKSFTNRRSLLGINNLLSALRFVLASPATIGETYLVADPGEAPTLAEIVAALRRAKNRPPRLLPMPPRYIEILLSVLQKHELWEIIGGNLQVDPAKLIAAGWQPVHSSLVGLTMLAHDDASGVSSRFRSSMPPNTPTPKT